LKESDFSGIEDQLKAIFRRIILDPVIDIIRKATSQGTEARLLLNSRQTTIEDALLTGRIQYESGVFSGQFSAAISSALRSIGAKFNRNTGTYALNEANVPGWVLAAANTFQSNAKKAHATMIHHLNIAQESLDEAVNLHPVDPDEMFDRAEKEFNRVGKNLEIPTEFTPFRREQMKKNYSENMKLWIKKWSRESILQLRRDVEANATQGYRFDKLIAHIQHQNGVNATKAKFLARQETSLFMSQYRQSKFQEAGVRRYVWQTSHDARVRDDHKHLDKQIFFYSSPPVVDRASGRRGNPGSDYNCRCRDRAILEAA
jgi:SPP1 gp7 family putative phage head morphogenesis protein